MQVKSAQDGHAETRVVVPVVAAMRVIALVAAWAASLSAVIAAGIHQTHGHGYLSLKCPPLACSATMESAHLTQAHEHVRSAATATLDKSIATAGHQHDLAAAAFHDAAHDTTNAEVGRPAWGTLCPL